MLVSVILNSSSLRNIPSLPPTTRQERLKTTRRRNRFLLPVSIVSALLIPAIILYSQQTIAGDCGPSNKAPSKAMEYLFRGLHQLILTIAGYVLEISPMAFAKPVFQILTA